MAETVAHLYSEGYITKFQRSTLLQGEQTPNFYVLPKIHSGFTSFPSLRPISNGYSSCTTKLSEYIDSFLKCAAQKTTSYVRDTTDFVNKIKNLDFSSTTDNVFLCSMDVNALYPNIDQEEGAAACEHFMNKRKTKSIPSDLIKSLVLTVLRSHTLNFLNRFFHQIKGTAMGTPMAVNFANLFMAKFEQEMLLNYREKHGTGPYIWFRYIDDIFMIWTGSQQGLEHFLQFCNSYSTQQAMASNITFKYSFSQTSVNFLDVTVSLDRDRKIQTDLYSKPTAAHQYLHYSSYHVPHVKVSLPKSQFMRIRRICTKLEDYEKNSLSFIKFFVSRGYNKEALMKVSDEVKKMNREELLNHKKQLTTNTQHQKRTTLVVTWSHKFTQISKILHHNYSRICKQYPQFKETFPEPPMVAYKGTKNLRNHFVRANHWEKLKIGNNDNSKRKPHNTKLHHLMNNTGTIEDKKTGRKFNIVGGKPSDSNVIYAAECLRHNLLYTGQTGGKLSTRFAGHRSDIEHYPERCKLPKHFKDNGCDFSKDLRVTILEHVKGDEGMRLQREAMWMSRLQTVTPHGLNSSTSEFSGVHKALFGP